MLSFTNRRRVSARQCARFPTKLALAAVEEIHSHDAVLDGGCGVRDGVDDR